MSAARWAQQELLEPYRQANISIYAVWFNMYPEDARSKWPSALLTDPRVVHYWDEPRAIGRLYLSNLPAMIDRRVVGTLQPTDDVLWDAFFVYAPGDRWQEPLPLPAAWGYPIMVTRDQLLRQVVALVGR